MFIYFGAKWYLHLIKLFYNVQEVFKTYNVYHIFHRLSFLKAYKYAWLEALASSPMHRKASAFAPKHIYKI